MIDWITGVFPYYCNGLISDGMLVSLSPTGDIDFKTTKRKVVTGSWEANITIRSDMYDFDPETNRTTKIQLSGNPVKFLQGHNLWGTLDVVNLVYSTLERIAQILGHPQPPEFYDAWNRAEGTISRVDINQMYSLGSRTDCLQYLHNASNSSRTRSQSAVTKGSTVYWNKQSRRWSMKAYSKGQEMELPRNNKPGLLRFNDTIKQWATDKLRLELTLKSNELRERSLHTLAEFAKIEPMELFEEYRERLTMSDQLELDIGLMHTLKGAILNTYSAWNMGLDCRERLSKPTFYRHRKQLLKYGIDISISKAHDNVVPLVRTITLTPATTPEWAYGTELYYEPRKIHVL